MLGSVVLDGRDLLEDVSLLSFSFKSNVSFLNNGDASAVPLEVCVQPSDGDKDALSVIEEEDCSEVGDDGEETTEESKDERDPVVEVVDLLEDSSSSSVEVIDLVSKSSDGSVSETESSEYMPSSSSNASSSVELVDRNGLRLAANMKRIGLVRGEFVDVESEGSSDDSFIASVVKVPSLRKRKRE